jgi:hypothetical protein
MRTLSRRLRIARPRSTSLHLTTRALDRRGITPRILRLAAVLSRLFASLRPRSGLAALTGSSAEPWFGT